MKKILKLLLVSSFVISITSATGHSQTLTNTYKVSAIIKPASVYYTVPDSKATEPDMKTLPPFNPEGLTSESAFNIPQFPLIVIEGKNIDPKIFIDEPTIDKNMLIGSRETGETAEKGETGK